MTATSSGHRSRSSKTGKKSTPSSKQHKFETFSQRIAKLKIDPIHRVRHETFYADDNADTTSCFRNSLEHWIDMNLSTNFKEFARTVDPLSESLPQILHHEDRIMGLLIEYIDKRDEVSLEPLLALVAQFARDLGQRFERHFLATVSLVTSVAATHSSVEVIEWSFTCLAWIFKFLSRLLVPDMRPLLRVMLPYLGKEKQKYFVMRFAAESMSFLIRKAAVVYYKNPAPLDNAITFLVDDLVASQSSQNVGMYEEGLMSMFAESIKGVNNGLYSNGTDILEAIIKSVLKVDDQHSYVAEEILNGVVVNIIHSTTVETFGPVLDTLCEHIQTTFKGPSPRVFQMRARLVFIISTTRKGTRVPDWAKVFQAQNFLLDILMREIDSYRDSVSELLGSIVTTLQTSPMDKILPFMRPVMEKLGSSSLSGYFLPFCSLLADLANERFQSIVLPYFQKFISNSWENYESQLCLLIPKLLNAKCITFESNRTGAVSVPKPWKEIIKRRFSKAGASESDLALLQAYAHFQVSGSLSNEPSIVPDLVQNLRQMVFSSFDPSTKLADDLLQFGRGQGFFFYVQLAVQSGNVDTALWPLIESHGVAFTNTPIFLEATLAYISAVSKDITFSSDAFVSKLLENLHSPSHELRLLSLKILQVFSLQDDPSTDEYLANAIEIEESELTLQTERRLSALLRKLAIRYHHVAEKKWLGQLLPNYCFGLLSKKLASLIDTACEALKTICEIPSADNLVAGLLIRFFEQPKSSSETETSNNESHPPSSTDQIDAKSYNDFQCFNVTRVERQVDGSFSTFVEPELALRHDFDLAHSSCPTFSATPRSQALQVLNSIPHVGEKRSRQIIPQFLSWAMTEDYTGNSDASSSKAPAWNQRDRKAMLSAFAQFVNPKVLYRAPEVHDALMGLLSNGDSDMQRRALKALFTWKSPSIKPYEENLLNLLDEARLRDELAVFVHVGKENSIIEEEHRAEVLPVIFRILYGRVVSRTGSRTNRGSQEARRKIILRTLSQLPDFAQFIQISYGVLNDVHVIDDGMEIADAFDKEHISLRKQFGLLRMIETIYEVLGAKMAPFGERSMNVVIYCLVRACRLIESENIEKDTMLRGVRSTGIHCMDLIFSISHEFDWTPYIPIVFREIISPRLRNFAIETAQGISGFLQIFRTWASHAHSSLYFTKCHESLMRHVIDILGVESARDEVRIFVLENILGPLLDYAGGKSQDDDDQTDLSVSERVRDEVLAPHVDYLLVQLEFVLRTHLRRQLTFPSISTLTRLAPFVRSSGETVKLVRTSVYLLRQPTDRVPPKAKSGLLEVLQHFLPVYDPTIDEDLNQEIFEVISSLFDYFKDNANRDAVSAVLNAFAIHDKSLKLVASLCQDLNALSEKKLDEVDFDRRLTAFRVINEELFETLTARQWRPLIFNFIYYLKDEEELAIRSSACFGLRRFIERSVPEKCNNDAAFSRLLETTLIPALRNGVRLPSELVRVEFVTLMGYVVSLHINLSEVNDMRGLLAGGDEEASFFANVLHIQQHRRSRAMRRLVAESDQGKIRSFNISSFFLPLIEQFVFNQSEDENAHNLAADAESAIGSLCLWLEWNQFRAIYRRYMGYIHSRPSKEKNVLRLLSRLTESLTQAVDVDGDVEMVNADDGMEIDDGQSAQTKTVSTLAKSLPSREKVNNELSTNSIPFLTDFVHQKDESQVSLRLPAAVIAVKQIKILPEKDATILLPPILLDTSYVLKSKVQETRDSARKTLSDITIFLGPSWFRFILSALCGALQRGYQLHVLTFTVHSILVSTSDHFKAGDLDNNLETLSSIVMNDIFGVIGQEKEAEEYISKMKEVKSSKGFDSMELLAKISSIDRLSALVVPLQTLLREKLNTRIVEKVDELFRRISVGLVRNPGAESPQTLNFSYDVIREGNRLDPTPDASEINDRFDKWRTRFMVNLRAAKDNPSKASTTSYAFKLARFGMDVLRAVLNRFNALMNPDNMREALPIIGDALVQAHEEVKLSAMRLLATIIKLPMPELDANSDVYIIEAVKMIREAPNMSTEAAQVALKFVSTILRERKRTTIKESRLAYLLKRIATDIEEPDRQGITFNFIRAVLSRKLIVPEIYEVVDGVAAMMVTNQTRSSRDLARGVYVHFVVEYPQAKARWSKQLAFLTKNLDYKHADGRQSVMEAIHMLLAKTKGDVTQDIVGTFFVPLVMVMANDESLECRQMAGVLMGKLFEKADSEHFKAIIAPLHAWLEQTDKLLVSVGVQAIRVFFECQRAKKEKEVEYVLDLLPGIIKSAEDQENGSWELLYFSLKLFQKLCELHPTFAFSSDRSAIWSRVVEALFYPHAWIRLCSAELIGSWFTDAAKSNASTGFASLPLTGSSGLKLNAPTMLTVLRASFTALGSPSVSEELAAQVARNLVFLGRCFAQNNLEYTRGDNADEDEETDGSDDDAENEEKVSSSKAAPKTITAIDYIFHRSAAILRREVLTTRAATLFPKTTCMKLLQALCTHLDVSQIKPSLQTMLVPLMHLTDTSIPAPNSLDEGFQAAYKSLVSGSQDILDILQKKLGTTEFVSEISAARTHVQERRSDRKVKRRIEAVADPVKFGAEKRRKHDRKRERRKEMGHEFKGRRRGW